MVKGSVLRHTVLCFLHSETKASPKLLSLSVAAQSPFWPLFFYQRQFGRHNRNICALQMAAPSQHTWGLLKKKDEWLMLHVAISETNCKDEHQLPSDHLLELSYMTMIPSSIVFIAVVKPKDSLCFDTVIIMHFRLSELTWNWFCLRSKARVLKRACHKEEAFNNLMALNAFNYSVADWKWPLHGK